MNHRGKRALFILIVAVIAATALGSYSALELRKTKATCEQLNVVIRNTNIKSAVLKRLLINAAKAREAVALLPESSRAERRINQRAAYLYRLDADIIRPTERLPC